MNGSQGVRATIPTCVNSPSMNSTIPIGSFRIAWRSTFSTMERRQPRTGRSLGE
jgi:hypothetical protein